MKKKAKPAKAMKARGPTTAPAIQALLASFGVGGGSVGVGMGVAVSDGVLELEEKTEVEELEGLVGDGVVEKNSRSEK
jgi:hypothetical protein